MGLFSTVLHIYKKSQADTVNELQNELQQNRGFTNFSKLDFTNSKYQNVLDNEVYSKHAIFYLITQPHGNWTTIIELNVFVDNPFYLYDLTNTLSKQLPATKGPDGLNKILNEGYWEAFDNNELDENGVPDDDKYYIDEQDRFERIGKYLEIYSKDDYPFADWLGNLAKLNLSDCYLLKAER